MSDFIPEKVLSANLNNKLLFPTPIKKYHY